MKILMRALLFPLLYVVNSSTHQCPLCFEDFATSILLVDVCCNFHKVCWVCATELQLRNLRCPLCRETVNILFAEHDLDTTLPELDNDDLEVLIAGLSWFRAHVEDEIERHPSPRETTRPPPTTTESDYMDQESGITTSSDEESDDFEV